jgi:diguanylate cyclase (GGDEF)-like protein
MMDLDFFKSYNDRYGHGAGDMLLAEVAKLVLREVREIDLVVRFGGEEFVVILPEAKVRDAVEVAERIRNRVVAADFFHAEDLPPSHITISLGVASYGEGVSNEEELIAMADQAMYAAKRFGRNRVEVYPA